MVSDFLRDFKYPSSSSGAFENALKINVVQEDGLIKLSQTPYIDQNHKRGGGGQVRHDQRQPEAHADGV
jgi:hypothetical protein